MVVVETKETRNVVYNSFQTVGCFLHWEQGTGNVQNSHRNVYHPLQWFTLWQPIFSLCQNLQQCFSVSETVLQLSSAHSVAVKERLCSLAEGREMRSRVDVCERSWRVVLHREKETQGRPNGQKSFQVFNRQLPQTRIQTVNSQNRPSRPRSKDPWIKLYAMLILLCCCGSATKWKSVLWLLSLLYK